MLVLDNPSFLSDFLTGKANLHRNEINQKMILWTVVRLVPLQKVHTVLDKFALIILRKLQFLGNSNLPKDISSPTGTTKISSEGSWNRKVFILRGP